MADNRFNHFGYTYRNIGMNTLWLHIMYNLDFKAALIQRLPKETIVPWIQMVVIYFVLQAISRVKIKK